MPDALVAQHLAFAIDPAIDRRPQDKTAGGVGEAAAATPQALLFQAGRGFVIGRQEHVERRAIGNLRVELAGAAE